MLITALAKHLARTTFGIGLAIGLVLVLSFLPVASAIAAATAPPCDGSLSVPPATQGWINVQCQIRQATFGDQVDPGIAYKFDVPINKNGTFAGLTYQSEAVTLTIVHTVQSDMKIVASELYSSGAEVYTVFGKLGGPAGKVPVLGIAMKGVTDDGGWMFMVASIPTMNQMDAFSAMSRLAGGVRVVNSTTGVSTPLDEVDSPTFLSAHSSDLSTLYCCNGVTTGNDVDTECLEAAIARYDVAMQAAMASLSACTANAAKVFAACMLLALGASIWTVIGAAVGAVACAVYLALQLDGCTDQYEIAANAARQVLRLDFEACGLIIYEI